MKVFLDTNVLIDNFDSSRPDTEASIETIGCCEKMGYQVIISALSMPNILYILRKRIRSYERKTWIVRTLCHACIVAPLERGDLLMATGEDFIDYEGGLQCLVAEKMGADYIVTNDKRGFRGSKVKVVTPREFLELAGA